MHVDYRLDRGDVRRKKGRKRFHDRLPGRRQGNGVHLKKRSEQPQRSLGGAPALTHNKNSSLHCFLSLYLKAYKTVPLVWSATCQFDFDGLLKHSNLPSLAL